MTEKEKRERLIVELDAIMARIMAPIMDLAGQRIALEKGKPLGPIRRALNDYVGEYNKQYFGAEVRQAVKIIERETTYLH